LEGDYLYAALQVVDTSPISRQDFSRSSSNAGWGENKVRLILSTALLLMLSCSALAAVETQQLGPYNVSFDMNTNMKYQLIPETSVEAPFANAYPLLIMTDNLTGARIFITEYKNLTDATMNTAKNIVRLTTLLRGFNVTSVDDLTIDGHPGFLVTGSNEAVPKEMKFYEAMYWLDSHSCECGPVSVGMVNVDITSSYPQDATEGLINSIHVVPAESPAK
jgi:hypothetical protein